jgi:hypothetical protein
VAVHQLLPSTALYVGQNFNNETASSMKTFDRSLSTTRQGELAQDGHVNNPSVTTDRHNGLMSLYADAPVLYSRQGVFAA